MKKKWIWLAPLAILALLAFIALGSEIVRLLWNWLFPPLFGWREIDFRQGLAILVLSRILFGGWGHSSGRSGMRRRIKDRMAERMEERWEQMTPEERERFREGLRGRCGFDPPASESKAP